MRKQDIGTPEFQKWVEEIMARPPSLLERLIDFIIPVPSLPRNSRSADDTPGRAPLRAREPLLPEIQLIFDFVENPDPEVMDLISGLPADEVRDLPPEWQMALDRRRYEGLLHPASLASHDAPTHRARVVADRLATTWATSAARQRLVHSEEGPESMVLIRADTDTSLRLLRLGRHREFTHALALLEVDPRTMGITAPTEDSSEEENSAWWALFHAAKAAMAGSAISSEQTRVLLHRWSRIDESLLAWCRADLSSRSSSSHP